MKKNIYYQNHGDAFLYTEFDVKQRKLNKGKMKKRKLSRLEMADRYDYKGGLNDISTKAIKLPEVRKDLMRLGIVW